MKLDRAHKRDGFSDNRGITLIEVLIGIAIMGIVSSMISAIMVGGTNFFRKQSATIDLQNDSQLITSSMSAAILEGTNFTLEEDKLMDGRRVVYFTTGTPAAEGENKAVAKQYICIYMMRELWLITIREIAYQSLSDILKLQPVSQKRQQMLRAMPYIHTTAASRRRIRLRKSA